MPDDDINAFVPGPRVHIEGRPGGPLSGLTFAAKDLFDVAGHPTGGGNPDWARSNPVPARHAWAVQRLLDAGATLIGKTITDEVSLGIVGENAFYGTPVNPRAPGRVPGGSSSGSAAAVAAGICDTALGTDTGGSVRVPASFCGLYGIRPTHGRLACRRHDAAGAELGHDRLVRARPRHLRQSGERHARRADPIGAAEQADDRGRRLRLCRSGSRRRLAANRSSGCRAMVGETREEVMAPAGIVQWARAQRTLQPSEAWLTFKDWIERDNPRFAYSVARNIFTGSQIPESERQWAQLVRQEARGRMRHLLTPGTILCLPTTPFPAPKRGEPLSAASAQRDRILCLCAHGGLTGVPQVSIPGAEVDGLPVGLSIVGSPGTDATLVAVAAALTKM